MKIIAHHRSTCKTEGASFFMQPLLSIRRQDSGNRILVPLGFFKPYYTTCPNYTMAQTLIRLRCHLISHSRCEKNNDFKRISWKSMQKNWNSLSRWLLAWKSATLDPKITQQFSAGFQLCVCHCIWHTVQVVQTCTNNVQTAKIRECRMPLFPCFWTQRLTLLCHKAAAAIGHTVHISSSLNLKKLMLISICKVCIPPVPLVSYPGLPSCLVSSWNAVKKRTPVTEGQWCKALGSNLLLKPNHEISETGTSRISWTQCSFVQLLDKMAAVSALLAFLKLTLIRKHKAV